MRFKKNKYLCTFYRNGEMIYHRICTRTVFSVYKYCIKQWWENKCDRFTIEKFPKRVAYNY